MITNKYSLPLPLQVWLANDEYDRVADAKYISATQILKPTRQTILSRRLPEITSDISDYLAASSGTAIHNDIEHSWESDKFFNSSFLHKYLKLILIDCFRIYFNIIN